MNKPDQNETLARLLELENPFARLEAIMALLRDPVAGCPWDRKQTLESLKPYLVEETYEVLDAIDSRDPARLEGELGDVLLQIVFQSRLATEAGQFTFRDVAEAICRKLIRRHPHVFGTSKAADAKEVVDLWEKCKQAEGGGLLAGIPRQLPALQKAFRMSQKAARVGFDWPEITGLLDKIGEEAEELAQAENSRRQHHELGDLLFALANLARRLDIEPEQALQDANARFVSRFSHVEEELAGRGREVADVPLAELDRLWEEAKRRERREE